MTDPSGNWTTRSNSGQSPAVNYSSTISSLRPTPPPSGRATPQPSSKPATPANDSFSNLVSFSSSNATKNLSLQEQQKRLAELKLNQLKPSQSQYAVGDETFWDNLGSGRSTPAQVNTGATNGGSTSTAPSQEEEDIFAAFNAPVTTTTSSNMLASKQGVKALEDDDDPFGLSQFSAQRQTAQSFQPQTTIDNDDDDVLGVLGQPIPKAPKQEMAVPTRPAAATDVHPQDKAVAELVDMGFPIEKARAALETTGSGTDVQAAVGWLLTQAHAETRQKSQTRSESRNGMSEERLPPAGSRRRGSGRAEPPSSRFPAEEDSVVRPRERSTPSGEKDPAQIAAEFGTVFFKTAGSLWKQGQKKVQQAVQEFSSDSETNQSNQPKWMRDLERGTPRSQGREEQSADTRRRRRSSAARQAQSVQDATDEAMMLEAARPTPAPRSQVRARQEGRLDLAADASRDHSPVIPSRLRESQPAQPAFLRQQQPPMQTSASSSRTALNRQVIEDQAAQAYVSSARRRRPAAPATVASEPDLLEGAVAASSMRSLSKPSMPSRPATTTPAHTIAPAPIPVRPSPPSRPIPAISAIALKATHSVLAAGNTYFERGDYSSAHQAYTTALSHLPPAHPLQIAILTLRSSTALKTGEPKNAISDSDLVISSIGPSKGESETLSLPNLPSAPMRDYYGRALMQKAEALEALEKWRDAALVWREAVQSNHGGATSIAGRARSEKMANPPPKPKIQSKSTTRRIAPPSATPAAAVNRLRAANAAAEKADDERFRLADSVDGRIATWKSGKADNLRALLGSLDTVLWPEAQWKKISMADLVLPNKVKIQYMKGIAKVHPDKVSCVHVWKDAKELTCDS